MRTILILIPLLVMFSGLKAQQEGGVATYYASFRSYFSGGQELPFWFRANQDGAFPGGNNSSQLLRTGFFRALENDPDQLWDYFMGADLVGGHSGEAYFHPNQYWLGIRYRWLVLKAGAMADSIRFGGLSSTNGNLDASNNARPVPNLSLATNGYLPFPVFPSVLSWKALYSEAIFWDNSYIDNARLHHKNLYFKVTLPRKWNLSMGVEHYVFWGGVSPTEGKISALGDYAHFVAGIKISPKNSSGQNVNLPENHLGIYNLELNRLWRKNSITFYWNHPFENRAGLEMANAGDGLWGVHWRSFDKQQYLTEVVYEWMNSLDQGYDATTGTALGAQDYFNDQTYRSGYTHYGQMMGSALFVPTLDGNGVSTGFQNNRIRMHHLGLKGFVFKNIGWKTMLTYTQNQGTFLSPFPAPRGEFSFLSEFSYDLAHLPVQLNAGVAGDLGELFENRVGIYLGLRWEPRQEEHNSYKPWVIRKR